MAGESEPPNVQVVSGTMMAHACRIGLNADLIQSIKAAAQQASKASGGTSAITILTAMGSLSSITLRMANATAGAEGSSSFKTFDEPLEIVSMVGTLAVNPGEVTYHIHASVADSEGVVHGGHLVMAKVHTTLELVLGSLDGVRFDRVQDAGTGYRELTVEEASDSVPNGD
jgi:uncharacterized protein